MRLGYKQISVKQHTMTYVGRYSVVGNIWSFYDSQWLMIWFSFTIMYRVVVEKHKQ